MNEKIIEKELSYQLVGIFFKIQKNLGRFCREKQYGDVLEKELINARIDFKREYPIEVGDRKLNFIDFFVNGKIFIDLKAKPFIEKEDFYQMKRYLEIGGLSLGLLVNFRDRYLKSKRVLNNKQKGAIFVDSNAFVVLDRLQGFTLMELVVAMGVFAAAMAFATGAFVQALKTQRVVNHLMSVNSNASLAMEQIAREIRTGYNFGNRDDAIACANTTGFTDLKFVNHRGKIVIYLPSVTGSIRRWECDPKPVGADCSKPDNFAKTDLTASNVKISDLCFIKTQVADCDPWRITMVFKAGSARPELASNALNIQTTISARILPEEVFYDAKWNQCSLAPKKP